MSRFKKMLLIVLGVIVICCLIPQRLDYKDGGSYEYRAIAYTIFHYHKLPPSPELEYTTGIKVKIFGITVYKKINNLYSVEDIIQYSKRNDIIHSGYIYDESNNKIISNYEDLLNNIDKLSEESQKRLKEKYNEEYFNNYNLAYVYLIQSSGSNELIYLGSTVDNTTVNINYRIDYPEVGTMDMSGYVLFIKIDKNIDKINLVNSTNN